MKTEEEYIDAAPVPNGPRTMEHLEKIDTIEQDNYHGLTLNIALVYLALLAIGFVAMITLISTGMLAQAMATDIGGASIVLWVPQSVTIVLLTLGAPLAQVADLWGRRWPLLICCASGIVGTIVLSRAQSMGVAIFGSILTSGPSLSQTLLWTIASEILPRIYRPIAQAGISIIFSAGAVAGLLIGSTLTKQYAQGWRYMWYINMALLVFATIVTFLCYRPPKRKLQVTLGLREKLKRLDWIGIVLLGVGATLFVMALIWSDNPYTWGSSHILGTFITGVIILIGLIVYEIRFKKDGLFHHGIFHHRNVPVTLFAVFVEGAAFFAGNTYVPMEIGVLGFESDPVRIGLRFSLVFIASIPASAGVALYSSRFKQIRAPMIFAFMSFCVFYGCMISVDLNSGKALWGYIIFLGFGIGGVLPLVNAALHLSSPPELIAICSGVSLCARGLGSAVVLPVFTAIFNSQMRKNVPKLIADAVAPLGLSTDDLPAFIEALTSQDMETLQSIDGVTPDIINAGLRGFRIANKDSLQPCYILALVLAFIGLVASCFLVDPKSSFTMHVDAPLEEEVTRDEVGVEEVEGQRQ